MPSTNKNVGSIADYDPLNGNWGSVNTGGNLEKLGKFLFLFFSLSLTNKSLFSRSYIK